MFAVSVKENVPSLAKTLFVNKVHVLNGREALVVAQSRNALVAGPAPVIMLLPLASFLTPASWGWVDRTMRKIVPPPPGPLCVVVPYKFPSGPTVREPNGFEPLVP